MKKDMSFGEMKTAASSLLADIERQLEHYYLTGRYSANNRHPVG